MDQQIQRNLANNPANLMKKRKKKKGGGERTFGNYERAIKSLSP